MCLHVSYKGAICVFPLRVPNTIFRNQFLKKSQIFTHAVIGRDVINIEFARNTTVYVT